MEAPELMLPAVLYTILVWSAIVLLASSIIAIFTVLVRESKRGEVW